MLNEKEMKALSDFENRINLPLGFYYKLLGDDDWSFVIKLHSLLEAAISYSLSESIKISFSAYNPEGKIDLRKIFSLLETSNKETGKLAFLKGMDILNSDYRGFILYLSQMRNKMVHNIGNVSMTIKQYYETLENPKKKDFRNKMICTIDSKFTINEKLLDGIQLFEQYPKIAIWYNAFQCISELYYLVKASEHEREINTLKKEISKRNEDLINEWAPIMAAFIKSHSN